MPCSLKNKYYSFSHNINKNIYIFFQIVQLVTVVTLIKLTKLSYFINDIKLYITRFRICLKLNFILANKNYIACNRCFLEWGNSNM